MWKVIGFMEGRDGHGYSSGRGAAIYGPLPRKVWKGGRAKRWRKIKPATGPSRPSKDEAYAIDERRAKTYAAWLAERDGLTIPKHGTVRCDWSSVESRTRTYTRRARWAGDKPLSYPTQEARIRAVEYGHMREVYNERKDGRQGAWLYNEFVAVFRIELPNWDFNPVAPVEIIEHEAEAA